MILITGASGLIGSHLLLRLLESGESARAIYRDESSKAVTKSLFELHEKPDLFGKIEWVFADILDIPSLEKAFSDITLVYHCAAQISFDPNDEEKLRKTNIEGTANIVSLCLEHQIRKLCHVSSIAAAGDLKDHERIVTEETEWNPEKPHNDYAISKHGAEMEIWRGQQEGLDVIIVSPGIVIGPPLRNSGSGKLFTLIANGHRFYTKGTADVVYVNDVVNIMVALMNSTISGERFILVSETLTFRELFFQVADAMKKKRPGFYARPWMTSIGWRLDWIRANIFRRKRIISRDGARSLHTSEPHSNEKIKMALGYRFTDTKTALKAIATLMKW